MGSTRFFPRILLGNSTQRQPHGEKKKAQKKFILTEIEPILLIFFLFFLNHLGVQFQPPTFGCIFSRKKNEEKKCSSYLIFNLFPAAAHAQN